MSGEILLESGTNELEVLEFYLGDQSYGINVAKVLQVEQFEPKLVTKTPESQNSEILGVYLWRNETLPIMDLAAVLEREPDTSIHRPLVLVTEFFGEKTAFKIDGVNRIYRVGWEEMKPISSFLGKYSSRTNGTLNVQLSTDADDKREIEILMLDFESIVAEYIPEDIGWTKGLEQKKAKDEKAFNRADVKVVLAEDSAFLRNMLKDALTRAGYTSLSVFKNGKLAFDYVEKIVTDAKEKKISIPSILNLIISDIEMPLMDGLTFCKKVKKDMGINVPVVFFSSLINEQMKIKCNDVGGDAQVTKPSMKNLITLLDELCQKKMK